MKKTNKSTKELLFENMIKLNPSFKLKENYEENFSDETIDTDIEEGAETDLYQNKINRITGVLRDLLQNAEFGAIDTIYTLLRVDKYLANKASATKNPNFVKTLNEVLINKL
jgi:hypothetical protein